jgi:hypothetical protein
MLPAERFAFQAPAWAISRLARAERCGNCRSFSIISVVRPLEARRRLFGHHRPANRIMGNPDKENGKHAKSFSDR